jgi:hypothetical protein
VGFTLGTRLGPYEIELLCVQAVKVRRSPRAPHHGRLIRLNGANMRIRLSKGGALANVGGAAIAAREW